MNRRDAIRAGAAGIAAAVVVTPAARGQAPAANQPELEPIRALLQRYDEAFANQDLDGVMACFSEKAALMGTGPGEIWSGPDEIKAAHQHFFDGFDKGEQRFDYEFHLGDIKSDSGWMLTSGNVTGKQEGEEYVFPVNISLTVVKDGGKWLVAAMHFSVFSAQNQEE